MKKHSHACTIILLSIILTSSILLFTSCKDSSNTVTDSSNTSKANIDNPTINASFDKIYPKPFFDTKTGKATTAAIFTAVTAVYLYITIQSAGSGGAILATTPAAVKFIATQIGMLMGHGSGATAAGLAIVGLGSMKGGILIIGSLISLGSGVITDIAIDQTIASVKNEPYKRYEYLKLPLLEEGSGDVTTLVKKIKDIEEDYIKGKVSVSNYKYMIEKEYSPKLINKLKSLPDIITTKKEAYDLINRAIFYFNTENYEKSERDFNRALTYAKENAFVLYGIALNNLVNNKYNDAFIKLAQCNIREPEALQPYILHIMALKDNGKYQDALLLAKSGLNNIGRKFALAWEAGEISYFQKDYKNAAYYFEMAFDEVDEDMIEAEAARMVALSYKRMSNNEHATKWYKKALKKAEGNKEEKQKIDEIWENE
ncbi:MAG: hypothetical protein PHC90_10990 [Syntrophorhabdaceae bacterium]|nr:hypothetical protein [Syntrophorhabdaceae bacterium]